MANVEIQAISGRGGKTTNTAPKVSQTHSFEVMTVG